MSSYHTHRNAVKLYGISSDDCKFTDCLESLDKSKLVDPIEIKSLIYDNSINSFVLFLCDIETTRRLLGRRLTIKGREITILPLLDFFIIRDVYPSVTKMDLEAIFSNFGQVFAVIEKPLLPGNPEMGHILSGDREISFILPKDTTSVKVQHLVFVPPYKFRVSQLCTFCFEEGHSIFGCPKEYKSDSEPKQENCDQNLTPDSNVKDEKLCLEIDDEEDDLLVTEFNGKISRTPSPPEIKDEADQNESCEGFPDGQKDFNQVLFYARKCEGILPPEYLVKLLQKQVYRKQDVLDAIGNWSSDMIAIQRQLLLFNKHIHWQDGLIMNSTLSAFLKKKMPTLLAALS